MFPFGGLRDCAGQRRSRQRSRRLQAARCPVQKALESPGPCAFLGREQRRPGGPGCGLARPARGGAAAGGGPLPVAGDGMGSHGRSKSAMIARCTRGPPGPEGGKGGTWTLFSQTAERGGIVDEEGQSNLPPRIPSPPRHGREWWISAARELRAVAADGWKRFPVWFGRWWWGLSLRRRQHIAIGAVAGLLIFTIVVALSNSRSAKDTANTWPARMDGETRLAPEG